MNTPIWQYILSCFLIVLCMLCNFMWRLKRDKEKRYGGKLPMHPEPFSTAPLDGILNNTYILAYHIDSGEWLSIRYTWKWADEVGSMWKDFRNVRYNSSEFSHWMAVPHKMWME